MCVRVGKKWHDERSMVLLLFSMVQHWEKENVKLYYSMRCVCRVYMRVHMRWKCGRGEVIDGLAMRGMCVLTVSSFKMFWSGDGLYICTEFWPIIREVCKIREVVIFYILYAKCNKWKHDILYDLCQMSIYHNKIFGNKIYQFLARITNTTLFHRLSSKVWVM